MKTYRVTLRQVTEEFFTQDFEAENKADALEQAEDARMDGLQDWTPTISKIIDETVDYVERLK